MKPACPVFDSAWRKQCKVVLAERRQIEPMIRRHYLGKWPGVCVLMLVMLYRKEAAGCIVFALPPRETSKRYGGETWELARLWVDNGMPQNAETWVISQAIRYIRRNHKIVRALVSYADPSAGHTGTVYRAANWRPDGRTDEGRKTPRCDYVNAATGKRYSRRSHVPEGTAVERVPRTSKYRFLYYLPISGEKR
ncbi:MAG: hypothetical protein KGJ13_07110 [Patescibacteria group bacterium]|nr:hypothetical protein [Patescibacteria group bacterium]